METFSSVMTELLQMTEELASGLNRYQFISTEFVRNSENSNYYIVSEICIRNRYGWELDFYIRKQIKLFSSLQISNISYHNFLCYKLMNDIEKKRLKYNDNDYNKITSLHRHYQRLLHYPEVGQLFIINQVHSLLHEDK